MKTSNEARRAKKVAGCSYATRTRFVTSPVISRMFDGNAPSRDAADEIVSKNETES